MSSKDILKNEKEELNSLNSKNKLKVLKSNYILQNYFNIMTKKISLEIIKYNKYIQNRLGININNYKEYSELYSSIEIELIPLKNEYGKFININMEDEIYYHIYFNNNKENEIRRAYLKKEEKISKINIFIDYQIKSLNNLFSYCDYIESIYFKKFKRNNINNMSKMFYKCSSLKELNLSDFNTNNVTDMGGMFYECSSLKVLNLSNFNTDNVNNMRYMFYNCSSLKELNISNFNTNNVIYMECMFSGCPNELILKIRKLKNFSEEAFEKSERAIFI